MSMRLVVALGVAGMFAGGRAQSEEPAAAVVEQNSTRSVSIPEATPRSAAPAPGQDTAAPDAKTVTVTAETTIPLTLVSQIKSRSTKTGDAVRAMVAFPVTAGTQLAIPAGTYVEGTITRLAAHTLQNKLPEVEVQFTRMLFANGYAVNLNANSTQARIEKPAAKTPVRESTWNRPQATEQPAGSFEFTGQSIPGEPTTPTPPPMNQPNIGTIAGATMGAGAALGIGLLVWAHHRATHMDYVLFDSGWQFQMVLTKPLRLDATKVSAAASTPRAQ